MLVSIVSMATPVFLAPEKKLPEKLAYAIVVEDEFIDLTDLPCLPYYEGDTLMVPLRKIAEALGYQVGWDAKSGAITVEDRYVQKATLFNGRDMVVFEGKLQIINMSREVQNAVKTTIHDGYTYVPLAFFDEFFNDTAVEGTTITVQVSKAYIQ